MSADWPSLADLLVPGGPADIALLGAPMEAGSVTPGRCDLAPGVVRAGLARFSTFDIDTGALLSGPVADLGDVPVAGVMPADGFTPIRDAVAAATAAHDLTLLLGGNNAITRPAAHGLGASLDGVGLITLDAHFDMRSTANGSSNGNPIRCLLEDGLPGGNICQIGLAPFANTRAMHGDAIGAGIGVFTIEDCRRAGIAGVVDAALDRLKHLAVLMVDFDIDVIDRAQSPGAPGARPGGMSNADFFAAARRLAAEPRVRLVDLTEFDPRLDIAEITALTAARWVGEVLAGFARRRPE